MRVLILVNGTQRVSSITFMGCNRMTVICPLLFVIVMDTPSKMISGLVSAGILSGFLVRNGHDEELHISHLFVCDILIFSEANRENVFTAFLLCFEAVSG